MGEILRHLVSKCLSFHSRAAINSLLIPLQLGVGVHGGYEAIVYAVCKLTTSLPDDRSWTLILDFTNAFNSISRQAMFEGLRKYLPGLSAWMESCYSRQLLLYMDSDTIRICCGVQQGDPLSPLGFAVTLHPLIEHIQDEVSSINLNMWYLNDGTLVSSPEDLAAALHLVELVSPSLGLHLNRGKSLLYIP